MAKVTISKPAAEAAATKSGKKTKKPIPVEIPVGKYINPLTDFGFKYIFGNKEFLMDFLNAILKIEEGIVDLQYDNTERPGRSEEDRTTIFDLYCTLKNGERIIIEMQHHRHDNFVDRTLYYSSRLIQEQGEEKKGDKEWMFELKPVYSVNIVNFKLDPKRKRKSRYVTYVHFKDDENKIVSTKLTHVFLELPYFTKTEHKLTDYIDWWTFVLKNLAHLYHLPDVLRNRIFERLFMKAEIAKLSKTDRKKYDQSLKKLSDMNIVIADRDRKIADRDRKIADKDRRIAEQANKIAELERRLGINGKPAK